MLDSHFQVGRLQLWVAFEVLARLLQIATRLGLRAGAFAETPEPMDIELA